MIVNNINHITLEELEILDKLPIRCPPGMEFQRPIGGGLGVLKLDLNIYKTQRTGSII